MGVTGLWTVLQPCARPIKFETLNKKRLAVDASIWIYQFLKAVRDKEGNALRNSHIVGFFRRICKLLFFGIKPVFVFDGGAPALKRQTISSRKSRREGRREDAVRTAGKLLALQMQRVAKEEEKKRKDARRHTVEEPEEAIPENVVYAEEVYQTQNERQQNRTFRKKDAYHLPDLSGSLSEMGGMNDPRIMSLEELEEYARQFDSGEDINVYDFSKIDFDSPFFVSLPASDRYNILNAARLRSRLRMGYSKDQLDTMFPDRMAFSKFQIERVRERNELTQRLMNLNGMTDDMMFGINGTSRVAGEKGREYVLVKNDGVEGGWALGVVTNKEEGQESKPIDVDKPIQTNEDNEGWEDEDDFEDVPIEGLNRLPKAKPNNFQDVVAKELADRRRVVYDSRKGTASRPNARRKTPVNEDPDSLFLAEEKDDEEWENVDIDGESQADDLFEDSNQDVGRNEEEVRLREAIELSLQQDNEGETDNAANNDFGHYQDVIQQQRAEDINPFASAKGSALAIARMANARSAKAAPKGPFAGSDSEDDDMDLQAALAESRKSKRGPAVRQPSPDRQTPIAPKPTPSSSKAPGFDGPLPFEKLDLGSSLLGKKKMKKMEEDNAGGFERDTNGPKKKSAEPLPPWFSGGRDFTKELEEQKQQEKADRERDRKALEEEFQFQELPKLRKQETKEVIDLDASQIQSQTKDIVTIDSDSEQEHDVEMRDVIIEDTELRMGDLAEKVRAEPPQPLEERQPSPPVQQAPAEKSQQSGASDNELIEWSESDNEAAMPRSRDTQEQPRQPTKSASPDFEDVDIPTQQPYQSSKSASPEFENVEIPTQTAPPDLRSPSPDILEGADDLSAPIPATGVADDNAPLDIPDDDSDVYSDPEDAELFASLAAEGEEHARFASSLNNNTNATVNFEEELKQLRSQQKKDRRDADEVTQTMITECQHLLTLFGLPYVTAPMEAEAQCAELVSLGLVDGIVTDDSDTFLFGGTRVYKNMFNAAKFVECYLASDLTSEFSLDREKMIAIAQLLGSDYTPGIPGIGPVTALEIISEFDTLEAFKEWWTAVQNNAISKDEDKGNQFRRRFRRTQHTKLFLPIGFPDPRVKEAYLDPEVDNDPQAFQWGVPDLDALRQFLSSQIGWSSERTDEVLVPVIKDMNRREKEGTQSNITRFFEGSVGAGAFAPRVRDQDIGGKKGKGAAGKRLGRALGRLAEKGKDGSRGEGEIHEVGTEVNDHIEENGAIAEEEEAPLNARGKRKKGGKATKEAVSRPHSDDDNSDEDDLYAEPRKKPRRGRKGREKAKP